MHSTSVDFTNPILYRKVNEFLDMEPIEIWTHSGDVCPQVRPGEGLLILFQGMAPYILLTIR